MDRDNRWDRVEQAYDLLTLAKGEFQADTAVAGLQAAYARDENDEFVKATVIRAAGQADAAMEDGDALIFMNFRATARVKSPAPSSTPTSTALRVRKWLISIS
ncbi:phosphoglyceromutase [Klebsiella pneumoniae]|uniref:phosphoglycerate mutase (2,3-diphosphoglycerate-independent) n=1 Tax=Klebsiella pneumoniae TaxID=573 RepID=A0A378B814_KLEPN|nr:phosphoglyceromutase [Klebsiella pneumoniae]